MVGEKQKKAEFMFESAEIPSPFELTLLSFLKFIMLLVSRRIGLLLLAYGLYPFMAISFSLVYSDDLTIADASFSLY